MKAGELAIIAVLLAPLPVAAAEPSTVSGGKELVLGRVFMTVAERNLLDQLRKLPPQSGVAAGSVVQGNAAQTGQKKKPDPVGYIVPPNGRAYKWIDGDFRVVTRDEIHVGPMQGPIRIIKHRPPAGRGESAGATGNRGGVQPQGKDVADPETGNDDRD